MRQIKKIAMIGAGSWGTAVAKNIAESKPHLTVIMWAYEKSVASSINTLHENTEFLPEVKLPANIVATNTLREAVEGSDVVILATPSKAAFDISQKMARFITPDMHVGFLTKGFCKIQGEVLTISQTMEQAMPQMAGRIVAISGPSHAEEVSLRFHTCLNVGGTCAESRGVIAEQLNSEYVQARETEDIRAVEVGGTLKNPAAIAAGMISALPRCGDNLAGALISEALKEMVRLGRIFGISEDGIIDISGLGDLVATALSDHSRNRRFGRDITGQIIKKGRTLSLWDRIVLRVRPASVIERMGGKMNYLAEGAYAIEPLIELAQKHNVPIPVYRSLYEVLLNKKDPSLLIETIKNPAKFDELFYNTKIQVSERKKGLEQMKGAVFREMIVTRTLEKFFSRRSGRLLPRTTDDVMRKLREKTYNRLDETGRRIVESMTSENFGESMRRLIELNVDSMADNYNPVFKWIIMMIVFAARMINAVTGKGGRLMVSGHMSEIKRMSRSVTVFYVHSYGGIMDSLMIVLSLAMKNLPFPRFFVGSDITGTRERFILKMCGGFIVDRSRLDDAVYRESLIQYMSTIAGHGVPVLYAPSYMPGKSIAENEELLSAVHDSLYRHTTELAMVPVEISYVGKPAELHGGAMRFRDLLTGVAHVNFSKPILLSEYTKRPHMIMGIPGTVMGMWDKDRKIFPHYIICKVLAENDYSIPADAAHRLVKKYMTKAGRQFDYPPAKIVKKGLRYLEKNSILSTERGSIRTDDRTMVDYYAKLLS
ncbi:MAG TPA: NAD(P)-binding domain-containing protein [Spirochaetota bacterium]|nr:NAD(P)-binding domain-containing protein [Spirochaetota bacterium]